MADLNELEPVHALLVGAEEEAEGVVVADVLPFLELGDEVVLEQW